jgi:ABC-2 type transport system permease protein
VSNKLRPPFPLALLQFSFVRILPMWCAIALVIFLMQIAVCGIVHDNESVKAMLQFLDLMPSIVKSILGGESLQVGNTSGLIAIGYQHPFVLFLFMFFAVGVPTGLLTGEVQSGTMELVLSRPVIKTHVYICAGLLTLVGMFALVMVMFLGTVVATNVYDFGEPIPLELFFRIAINGGLFASTAGAVTLLCAAALRSRNMAVGAAVGFLVVNYFISIISEWWPRMGFLKGVTLFYYVGGLEIVAGWPIVDMCVLTAILLIAAFSGAIVWQRRDLPL